MYSLLADLRVTEKTLKVYDKSAHHLTLEKIDNLLTAEGISLSDLMTERVRTSITRHEEYFVWVHIRKRLLAKSEVKKMAKKTQRITLYKHIWARIRYWQNLRDVSDAELRFVSAGRSSSS